MKYKWYYKWHTYPFTKTLHYIITLLYLIGLPWAMWNYPQAPQRTKADEVAYNFPRWEWNNPQPTKEDLQDAYKTEENGQEVIWAVGNKGTIIKRSNSSWKQQYNEFSDNLSAIDGSDSEHIWAVGDNGLIIKYNGQTWSSQESGVDDYLNDIAVYNSNIAYVVGNNGIILKTINGGTDWVTQGERIYGGNKIGLLDADNVWVAGDNLIKTSDGGVTWVLVTTDIPDNFLSYKDIQVLDENNIITLSYYYISKTVDGGTTWYHTSIQVGMEFYINGFYALGPVDLVLYGGHEDYGGEQEAYLAQLYGICGSEDSQHFNCPIDPYDPSFDNLYPLNKILVLGDGSEYRVGNKGVIDHREGWSGTPVAQKVGTARQIGTIDVASNGTIYARGRYEGGLKSTDTGVSWQETAALGTRPSIKLQAVSPNKVVSLDDRGFVYTLDGGESWASCVGETLTSTFYAKENGTGLSIILPGMGHTGVDEYEIDGLGTCSLHTSYDDGITRSNLVGKGDTVYDLGSSGQIYKSINFGHTWQLLTTNSTARLLNAYIVDDNVIWVTSYDGTILKSINGGTSWNVYSPTQTGLSEYILAAYALDGMNAWAVGATGTIIKTTNGGANWSIVAQGKDIGLSKAVFADQNNIWATNGGIMRFHRPSGLLADKLLLQLPGQEFINESGLTGTPSVARAGVNYAATVYTVSDANKWDIAAIAPVGFSTTDPNDTNPADIATNNEGLCPSISCGKGTTNFVFHTPGTWTARAYVVGGGLSPYESSQITVIPGYPSTQSLTPSSMALPAGQASAAITLQIKDMYSNNTTVDSNTTIHLTTSSSRGRFSTSPDGPWSLGSLDLTIPSGSGSVTFYYLDFAQGTAIIKTTSTGLSDGTASIIVTPGALSQSNLTVGDSSLSAGQSTSATATLKDSGGNLLSGKTVTLYTSRGSRDTIIPANDVSNSSGIASFTIRSQVAGTSTLSAKADSIWLEDNPIVSFSPGAVSQVSLDDIPSTTTANYSLSASITLKDRYGNKATNARGKIITTSTDKQAVLPSVYSMNSSDSGQHDFNIKLRTIGSQTITFSYPETNVSASAKVAVLPTTVSRTISSIKSNKSSIKPDGKDSARITVTLKDDFGNPINSKEVKVKSSRNDDAITTSSDNRTTNSSGEAYFLVTSKATGESKISAIDITDDIQLSQTIRLSVTESSLASILSNIKDNKTVNTLTRRILRPIAQTVATVGLITIIVQAVAALPSIFQFLAYLIALLAEALGIKRKPKPWGVVFDSLSGKPIDLAVTRLFDSESKRLVATRVTDLSGKFGFSVDPGTYMVSVTKPGYIFPITRNSLSYLSREQTYYVGAPIKIEKKMENLSLSIPIEPVRTQMSFYSKMRILSRDLSEWISSFSLYIFVPILALGIITSAISAYVLAETKNYILMDSYFIMAGFYIIQRSRSQRRHGTVLAPTGDHKKLKRLANALIYVYDAEFETLRGEIPTDNNGRYTLFVPKGKYYLTCKASGFEMDNKLAKTTLNPGLKHKFYEGEIIDVKHPGYINEIIKMRTT